VSLAGRLGRAASVWSPQIVNRNVTPGVFCLASCGWYISKRSTSLSFCHSQWRQPERGTQWDTQPKLSCANCPQAKEGNRVRFVIATSVSADEGKFTSLWACCVGRLGKCQRTQAFSLSKFPFSNGEFRPGEILFVPLSGHTTIGLICTICVNNSGWHLEQPPCTVCIKSSVSNIDTSLHQLRPVVHLVHSRF